MKSFGISDRGLVRHQNEDCIYFEDGPIGIYVVADGMGGYEGGALASELATKNAVSLAKEATYVSDELIKEIFLITASGIKKLATEESRLAEMGTTLTLALISEGQVTVGHIGDSRAYYIEAGQISQITEDHTLVQALYKNGTINEEELASHPNRNVLLKALNSAALDGPDIHHLTLPKGAYLLLCSDGLTGHLKEDEVVSIIEDKKEPKEIAITLVRNALEKGGHDNIAVVVVKG